MIADTASLATLPVVSENNEVSLVDDISVRGGAVVTLLLLGDPVKVKPSVKKICNKCRVIRRHGRVMIICTDPRHKQRQG